MGEIATRGQIQSQASVVIQQSIRSPANPGETLKRASVCLALYFDPDNDPEIKAAIREAFVRALDSVPTWAMHRAFDKWERTGQRRPSPAEIVILAERELKPMADELASRKKAHDEAEAERVERSAARVTPEAAARIMAEAGMTQDRLVAIRRFPMAGSVHEAKAKSAEWDAPTPHWSDTAAPDDPAWVQLRASRAASGLVQAPTGDAA